MVFGGTPTWINVCVRLCAVVCVLCVCVSVACGQQGNLVRFSSVTWCRA